MKKQLLPLLFGLSACLPVPMLAAQFEDDEETPIHLQFPGYREQKPQKHAEDEEETPMHLQFPGYREQKPQKHAFEPSVTGWDELGGTFSNYEDDALPPLEFLESDFGGTTTAEDALANFSANFHNSLVYLYPEDPEIRSRLQNTFEQLFEENLAWLSWQKKGVITNEEARAAYDALKERLVFKEPEPIDDLLDSAKIPLPAQECCSYSCNTSDRYLGDFTISPKGELISSSVHALLSNPSTHTTRDNHSYSKQWLIGWESEISLQKGNQRTSTLHTDPQSKDYASCAQRTALASSPSGTDIAFAQNYLCRSAISIFNTNTQEIKKLKSSEGTDTFIYTLCFSPNGRYLIGNMGDPYGKQIKPYIWDAKTGERIEDPTSVGYFFPSEELTKNKALLIFSADAEIIAVVKRPNYKTTTVTVLDHLTGETIASTKLPFCAKSVEFSQDKSKLVIAGFAVTAFNSEIPVLKVLHLSENLLQTQDIPLYQYDYTQKINKAVFTPDGTQIMYSGESSNACKIGLTEKYTRGIFKTVKIPKFSE